MKCNAKLSPNYFSVNFSVLAVVFHRQISKNRQFSLKFDHYNILIIIMFYWIKNQMRLFPFLTFRTKF